MTERYAMRPTDASGQDRADEVTEAFFDAIEAAATATGCNGAEIVAGLAYVLGTLATTATFDGAPGIVAEAFRQTGLQLPQVQ